MSYSLLALYFHLQTVCLVIGDERKSWKKINQEKCIDTVNGLLLLLFHHVANYFISASVSVPLLCFRPLCWVPVMAA
jgi:hypothetical protein